MIDYDKLFKNGNFVALRNMKTKQTFYYFVTDYNETMERDNAAVDWENYYNPELSYTANVEGCGDTLFKIMFVAELDFRAKKVHVLYERENNINEALITPAPMPELKTGLVIELHTSEGNHKGIIVEDKIIYSDYGFDYVEDFDENSDDYEYNPDYCIIKIWDNGGYGFDSCNDNYLIWSREEN